MPVNPRLLFQTQSNFMQTRGNLSTAIEVMRGADTAWPRPSLSGKLEIYCQFKADNVNRTGLNPEPIKPYANYFVPRRGYQETFVDGEIGGERAKYPLQAFTPHYMRRAHTCYDNMPWTQEAFRNPVFMSVEDAEARGIKAGDTVKCYNDFGAMLRHAQPLKSYLPGVVGIPHGVRSVFDESGDQVIDRGGSEQMLSDGMQSNYFNQVDGYNSLLIEIEKYDGCTGGTGCSPSVSRGSPTIMCP